MTEIELSIVMPCLDEARTLGTCIARAQACTNRLGINAEIIVADNGSTDGSQAIARSMGATVISVQERGYGAAVQGGIDAATGRFVVMGDADDSYDFSRLDLFVEKLRAGADLVLGDRFAGGIGQNAMPFLHRYVGNPVLSFVGRLFFGTGVRDFHCGLRGFRRDRIQALELACPGMEFASEMVIRASLAGYDIAQVPTTLDADGRDRPPHLRTFRDGWRHLQLLLIYSPRWLFFYPGVLAFLIGSLATIALVFGDITLGDVSFGIHTLLYSAALSVLGLQMIFFGLLVRLVASGLGSMPEVASFNRLLSLFTLERGLVIGGGAIAIGLLWSLNAVWQWGQVDFSSLDPATTMRLTIPAVTLLMMGIQTIMSSFFLGALQLYQQSRPRTRT